MHDPGVVIADVEAPEALDRLVEERPHRLVVRYVRADERRLAARALDERDRLGPGGLVDVVHHDPRALLGKEGSCGSPEPAARAGDEADLAVQERHGRLP